MQWYLRIIITKTREGYYRISWIIILLLALLSIDSILILYYLYGILDDPGPYIASAYVLAGVYLVSNVLKNYLSSKKKIIKNIIDIYRYTYGDNKYNFTKNKIYRIFKTIIILSLTVFEIMLITFIDNIVPSLFRFSGTVLIILIICTIFRFLLGFLFWYFIAISLAELLSEYLLFRICIKDLLEKMHSYLGNLSLIKNILNSLEIDTSNYSNFVDGAVRLYEKLRYETYPLRLLSLYSLFISVLSLTYPFVVIYLKCIIFRMEFHIYMIFKPWAFIPSIVICIISIVVISIVNLLLLSIRDIGNFVSFLSNYYLLSHGQKDVPLSFLSCMNYIVENVYGRNFVSKAKLVLSVIFAVLSILFQALRLVVHIV